MKLSDILGNLLLRAFAGISTRLTALEKGQEKLNMDFSKLQAAADKVVADQKQLDTDVRAYFTANPPSDPAAQAQVDKITASLEATAGSMEALDAATKPVQGSTDQP